MGALEACASGAPPQSLNPFPLPPFPNLLSPTSFPLPSTLHLQLLL